MNSLLQQSQTYLDNNNADIKSFALEALKLLPSGWGCRVDISLQCYHSSGRHEFKFSIYPVDPDPKADYAKGVSGTTKEECLSKVKKTLEIHEMLKTI